MSTQVHGKTLEQWRATLPELEAIMAAMPQLWINPEYRGCDNAAGNPSPADIDEAANRLHRFAAYIERVFPQTAETGGLIESPLRPAAQLQRKLASVFDWRIPGRLMLKCDNQLAVSGSIKARGGFYEVLKHAESLALENALIGIDGDYTDFDSDEFRQLFARHAIAVGSTGNLGLSIGILSARLGFRVTVHMSADARRWKKELLRDKGVNIIEYESDYGEAVRQGRAQAQNDPSMHFVDDEKSLDLFLGYAVAAGRLRRQLRQQQIEVDADHPLFVFLPCGVGGGPGGISFGLKREFGEHVHCFFAEPVASPCMLLGLMTGLHDAVDVRDFGLDNITESDGLAVARPSGLVCRLLQREISGIFTIQDEFLFRLLRLVCDTENQKLEPSASAGITGPAMLLHSEAGRKYLQDHDLSQKLAEATFIVWATGGGMLPAAEFESYYRRGLYACG